MIPLHRITIAHIINRTLNEHTSLAKNRLVPNHNIENSLNARENRKIQLLGNTFFLLSWITERYQSVKCKAKIIIIIRVERHLAHANYFRKRQRGRGRERENDDITLSVRLLFDRHSLVINNHNNHNGLSAC